MTAMERVEPGASGLTSPYLGLAPHGRWVKPANFRIKEIDVAKRVYKPARRFLAGYMGRANETVYGRFQCLPRDHPNHRRGDECALMTKKEARKALGELFGATVFELVPVCLDKAGTDAAETKKG